MLYLVFFKSAKLKEYKYYLLPTITFAYLFELLIAICQPVFIFPILGGYARGLIQNTSSTVAFVCFMLILLSAAYGLLGVLCSMLFRYKIIAPMIIKKWINIRWIYYGIVAYGYIGVTVAISFWMYFLRPNKKNLDAFVLANPEYADLVAKEPTFILFNSEEFPPSMIFVMGYAVIIISIISSLFIIFHLEKWLYDKKPKLSPTTFKLQKMMNTYFKAEVVSAHLFLLLPLTIAIITMHTKNPNGAAICHGALMFGSLYCVSFYFSTIYFIKPYRVWLAKIFFVSMRWKNNNMYYPASTS